MIGYVTVGTNDFEGALAFYDALFSVIDIKRLWKVDSMAAWGPSRDVTAFCLTAPYNKQPSTIGNGVMIALKMASQDEVRTLHAKALELGGADEGAPGPRGEHGFYGAYFRDLDGNKLNAYIPG